MKTHHHPNRALSQEDMEARRLKAVPYFNKAWPLRRIGKKLGVSFIAAYQWKTVWKKEGAAGLKAGRYGHPSKLTSLKEKAVKKKILQGAEAHGFSGDFWTLKRVTKAVKSWTGVPYRDRSVWHLLRRLGFSCQKPVRRAIERDEKAIGIWKQNIWPVVKKGALKRA